MIPNSSEKFLTINNHSLSFTQLKAKLDQKCESSLFLEAKPQFNFFIRLFHALLQNKVVALIPPNLPQNLYNIYIQDIPPQIKGPGIIIFTSGTCGRPRPILLSLENLNINALQTIKYFSMEEREKTYLTLPLYHVSGFLPLWRCLLSGGELIMNPNVPPHFSYTSMVNSQIKKYENNSSYQNSKAIIIGGSLIGKKPHCLPLVESYGMTETCGHVALDNQILPQYQWKNGSFYGEGIALGHFLKKEFVPYHNKFTPPDNLKVQDGHILVLGRKDQVFISGGYKVHPQEIEKTLLNHPEISVVKVLPKTHDKWGQVPMAFVDKVPRNLNVYLKKYLAFYKIPKIIHQFPPLKYGIKWKSQDLYKWDQSHPTIS